MAEVGRREVVGDPLALNPASQAADRSLSLGGVRNPGQDGGQAAVYNEQMKGFKALDELNAATAKVAETKKDEYITEGKLAFMQGTTEQQIVASGNKYSVQGWQMLSAADKANRWYANELVDLQNGANKLAPEEYNKLLMEKRAQFINDLPDDPEVRKIYAAAFADLSPRLGVAQVQAHNDWNTQQSEQAFGEILSSGSYTNADASQVIAGAGPLALSPGIVRPTVSYTESDVDTLTRTMLGEAAGEGPIGLAAVAHVVVNRAIDGGYGGTTITAVSRAPQQFSAWNAGAGGNNPNKWDPNSATYQNAKQVAMAVLSGHNVDPTNGATHYYSPAGMKALVAGGSQANTVPGWLASEAAKSNGTVQIGGHIFAGKARGIGAIASVAPSVLPAIGTPGEAADALPDNYNEVNKIDEASLVDLVGSMSPAQEAAIKARAGKTIAGVKYDAEGKQMAAGEGQPVEPGNIDLGNRPRVENADGTISTVRSISISEDGLEVLIPTVSPDGKILSDDDAVALYKETGQHLGKFNTVAEADAAAEGIHNQQADSLNNVPSAAIEPAPVPSTQIQELIRGSTLPPERKALQLGQQIITQLQAGSEQLFNDAGGIAMLNELNADPQLVRQVQAAKEAYDKDQQNKFNLADVEANQQLIIDVSKGNVTKDDALASVQAQYDAGNLSDERAKALAGNVLAEHYKYSQQENLDSDVQRSLANIYRSIQTDPVNFDAEWASEQVRILGAANDLPESQINTWVEKMWAADQAAYTSAINNVETADKQRIKDAALTDVVNNAISQGYGLAQVSGNIGTGPGAVEAQQAGVNIIRDRLYTSAKDAVPMYMAGGLTQEESQAKALSWANKQLHMTLNAQGVVDKEMQSAFTASSVGVITNKDGTVRDSTINAFDAYLQMVNDPEVGSAYASQYFTNADGRDFMTLAAKLYAGDFDLERSLLGAQEILKNNQGKPLNELMTRGSFDTAFNIEVEKGFNQLLNTDIFVSSGIPEGDAAYAKGHMQDFSNVVYGNALSLKGQRPWVPDDVLAKQATENVIKDTFLVGGNFVYGDERKGERLDQVMGLVGYPKDAPNAAITDYITEFAQEKADAYKQTGIDADGWGRAWKEREPNYATYGLSRIGNRGPNWTGTGPGLAPPPYYVTYDRASGMMYAYLWSDDTRTTTVDIPPIQIDVTAAGAAYDAKRRAATQGPVDQTLNFFKGLLNQDISKTAEQAKDTPGDATIPGVTDQSVINLGEIVVKP